MSTEPGWYPDQRAAGQLRFYDGGSWTEHTMPAPPAGSEHTVPLAYRLEGSQESPGRSAPTSAPNGPAPAPDTLVLAAGHQGAQPPWHTRWWIVGGVALVVGLLVGTAVTGGSDLKGAATPPAPTATVTVTESPTPTSSPTPSPTASSDDSVAGFAMPDEVGQQLQRAQDDLQSISGKTFFYTGSTDAAGQGRLQILDRDWKVCTQSIAPGTQVSVDDRSISFGAVKLDEDCP